MSDLTEQWDKGKLPEGDYYIKRRNGLLLYDNIDSHGVWHSSIDEDIVEVLAPVPSYDEWQAKDDALTTLLAEYGKLTKELQDEKEKHMIRPSLRSPADEMVIEKQVWASTLHHSMVLQAENAQLKELLKECQSKLNYCTRETYELKTKINQALGEDK